MKSDSDDSSTGSKIGRTLIFLALFAFGLFAAVLFTRDDVSARPQRLWPQMPCTILRSAMITRGTNYLFAVRYRYNWQGTDHVGDVYQSTYTGSEDATEAQRLVVRYPANTDDTCLVNPANPADAVLSTPSSAGLLKGLFPLLFSAIGAAGMWFTWRPLQMTASMNKFAVMVFGMIFAGAGLGLLFGVVVPNYRQYHSAQSWPAKPCVVESSHVRSYSGKHGDTYRIDILYRYDVDGVTYRSNHYDASFDSSSGYAGKMNVVRQYPPGRQTLCYVNPADPVVAMLSRSYPSENGILIPLALIFAAIGTVIMWASLKMGSSD